MLIALFKKQRKRSYLIKGFQMSQNSEQRTQIIDRSWMAMFCDKRGYHQFAMIGIHEIYTLSPLLLH